MKLGHGSWATLSFPVVVVLTAERSLSTKGEEWQAVSTVNDSRPERVILDCSTSSVSSRFALGFSLVEKVISFSVFHRGIVEIAAASAWYLCWEPLSFFES